MVARQALRDALGRKPYVRYQAPTSVLYSEEIAEEVLDRLANGESLFHICKDAHMPSEKAVRLWVTEDRGANAETGAEGFASKYTRARDFGYDSVAEQVLAITDRDFTGPDGYVDNGSVQVARLESENSKWFLSKMQPKRYGDKVTTEVTGADGGQLITRIELIPVDPRPIIDGSPVEARDPEIEDKRQKR